MSIKRLSNKEKKVIRKECGIKKEKEIKENKIIEHKLTEQQLTEKKKQRVIKEVDTLSQEEIKENLISYMMEFD